MIVGYVALMRRIEARAMNMPNELKVVSARVLSDVDLAKQPQILTDTLCPLILIAPDKILCATSKAQKRELLGCYCEAGGILLMAWPGRKTTDVFIVTLEDVKAQHEL